MKKLNHSSKHPKKKSNLINKKMFYGHNENSKKEKRNTDKRQQDNADVESKAGGAGDKEIRDGVDADDGGGDGNGGEELEGEDGVDLAYEGPAQAVVLGHGGVERPVADLDVSTGDTILDRHFGSFGPRRMTRRAFIVLVFYDLWGEEIPARETARNWRGII